MTEQMTGPLVDLEVSRDEHDRRTQRVLAGTVGQLVTTNARLQAAVDLMAAKLKGEVGPDATADVATMATVDVDGSVGVTVPLTEAFSAERETWAGLVANLTERLALAEVAMGHLSGALAEHEAFGE